MNEKEIHQSNLDFDVVIEGMKERGDPIYYYEDKPYKILHEGKIKAISLIKYMDSKLPDPVLTSKELEDEMNKDFERADVKWIDVVIYEPLYAECDIRICVKEKGDFYNNYKPKQ